MGTKPAKVGHLALGPFNVLKWVPGGSDSQKDLHFTKSGRRGLEGPRPVIAPCPLPSASSVGVGRLKVSKSVSTVVCGH